MRTNAAGADALECGQESERAKTLWGEMMRARLATLRAGDELRAALAAEPVDLGRIAHCAEAASIETGRLAGFARFLKLSL